MPVIENQFVQPADAAQMGKDQATRRAEAQTRAEALFPGAKSDPSPTPYPDYAGDVAITPR